MTTATIAYVQWPDNLLAHGPEWDAIRRSVDAARADILVTNEMPFGPWAAQHPAFDAAAAARSVELHEKALAARGDLGAGAVISSRPVAFDGRLANEAFVLEAGRYRCLHHKQYFPQEAGFFEEAWYAGGTPGFECMQIGAVKVGVLLCTELFFNEHARHYGRQGADVIVTPRASGTSLHRWTTAGAMAAIVSGTCFVSSNRRGVAALGQTFGGYGFAMSSDGQLTGHTSDEAPLVIATIDLERSREDKRLYPCYVKELPAP
jgi:N-carbamoylputrescine amidase